MSLIVKYVVFTLLLCIVISCLILDTAQSRSRWHYTKEMHVSDLCCFGYVTLSVSPLHTF